MNDLRRIVLDVLQPHDPSLIELTRRVTQTERVEAASASLIELDTEVRNVKITVEGEDLDYGAIEDVITDLGGTVHSIDQVACGTYIVEEKRTLQDR